MDASRNGVDVEVQLETSRWVVELRYWTLCYRYVLTLTLKCYAQRPVLQPNKRVGTAGGDPRRLMRFSFLCGSSVVMFLRRVKRLYLARCCTS
jgi:hypothetical protein